MTRTWTPGTPDEALAALARTPRLLIALDFDGTASEFAVDPMSARAVPGVAAAVDRLAAMPETRVAYVSGRSMQHLRVIVEHGDHSPIALAGSHGAEYWLPGAGAADPVDTPEDAALRESVWAGIAQLLAAYPGIRFERKTYGVGVHSRGADPVVAEQAFAAVDAYMAENAPQWRRRTGNEILEFSSQTAGKDAAIARLRESFDATAVLFAGDDTTDEDALRVMGPGDLGVRVGAGETAASLRVADPTEMGELLAALADERRARRE